ncbi:hypothetical protein [Sorangium sp. So ce131]|uniref:hypothetical protein n=1 Tax=Sorangium sp. So ce131 TaxID=3133282 RepID=UPI003F5E489F
MTTRRGGWLLAAIAAGALTAACAPGTILWLVNYGTTNGVNNPLLTMPTTGTITALYNAQYTQSGGELTIWGPSWKPNLAAGESAGDITMCASR